MHPFPHTYQANAEGETTGSVMVSSPRLAVIASEGPKEFGGPGDQWSPETMLVAAVADCLQHVDGRARQAIDQAYRDRRSRVEIARNLQMKPDGVKSLLRRTRELLRQCIERKSN